LGSNSFFFLCKNIGIEKNLSRITNWVELGCNLQAKHKFTKKNKNEKSWKKLVTQTSHNDLKLKRMYYFYHIILHQLYTKTHCVAPIYMVPICIGFTPYMSWCRVNVKYCDIKKSFPKLKNTQNYIHFYITL